MAKMVRYSVGRFMRKAFLATAGFLIVCELLSYQFFPQFLWSLVLIGPLLVFGFIDYFQKSQTIRRNFPLLGRMRYLFELVRPEINQYFVESNTDGRPFSREQRSIVYQRAKRQLDTLPFGTQKDVYEVGYEWVNHSMQAVHVDPTSLRCIVGGVACKKPYSASILNISAMSYGSLSKNAVLALNGGAKDNGFAHNTGEGGVSPYHLEPGGDLIWQIGTGYFGCRTEDGRFNDQSFANTASLENVKMIEIKLSQGAKPAHGGILPASKVSKEISRIRHVPMGKDVISPPVHSEFSTPIEMMEFTARLRDLSGGKPVGIKLCIGKRREFIAVCKAMERTGILPDYIAVDGGEGGTGAAPLEFSNHIGSPSIEALVFVDNVLRGFGLRKNIRLFASGKVNSGFGAVKLLALGADCVYSARSMMLALGCIQALRCNSNVCPTGVATQDPELVAGLVVSDKRIRVSNYHRETIESIAHIIGAMGLTHTNELQPWHIMRRIRPNEVRHYNEIYPMIEEGALLKEPVPQEYERAFRAASAETFRHVSAAM